MKLVRFLLLWPLLFRFAAAAEVEVIYEVFSMPMNEASKIRRERLGGEETYRRVLEMVTKAEARQERMMAVKMLEGGRAVLEEIHELIYPTEYEPLELPSMVGSSHLMKPPKPFPVPDTASAYDTRGLGDFLELELLGKEGDFILKIVAAKVDLVELDVIGRGIGEVTMPRFAIQKFRTEEKVRSGKPALVGTASPPRDLQEGEGKRVWLAFVTVTAPDL